MNISNIKKIKGYISGKEWNSETRSSNGNIFLNFKDFQNMIFYGINYDELTSIVQTLNEEKCIVHIDGVSLYDEKICYELLDYKKTFRIIDDVIGRSS